MVKDSNRDLIFIFILFVYEGCTVKRQATAILVVPLLFSLVLSCAKNSYLSSRSGSYFNMEPPGIRPEIFAPGIISTEYHEHSSPMFSRDGKEVYWSVFYNFWGPQVIVFMRYDNNRWTRPRVAPFSGQYSDGNPCLLLQDR